MSDYPTQTEAVSTRMEITLASGKTFNAVIVRDDAEAPFLTIARSDKRYFIIGNLLRN